MKISFILSSLSILLLTFYGSVNAQLVHSRGVARPNVSQAAQVYQQIGITDILIKHHRPRSYKRSIWGLLVPYNEVWRAGANENTTISFSTDVVVNGKELKAGEYGLHVIPRDQGNWTVIFSSNSTSWGSFFYDEKEDALRVEAVSWSNELGLPEELTYGFTSLDQRSCTLELRWAGRGFDLNIEIDLLKTVINNFRQKELRNLPRFTWEGRFEAATFCLAHNTNLKEALIWINSSIEQQERFENLIVKSDILKLLGRSEESVPVRHKALSMASSRDISVYGLHFMGIYDNPKMALEVFELNAKLFSNSINPYTEMARALFRLGRHKEAEDKIRIALKKAKDEEEISIVKNWAKILKIKL